MGERLGDVVCARATRVAGGEMDAAITAHVRQAHQFIIGEPTAERVKVEIGSAILNGDELSVAFSPARDSRE